MTWVCPNAAASNDGKLPEKAGAVVDAARSAAAAVVDEGATLVVQLKLGVTLVVQLRVAIVRRTATISRARPGS